MVRLLQKPYLFYRRDISKIVALPKKNATQLFELLAPSVGITENLHTLKLAYGKFSTMANVEHSTLRFLFQNHWHFGRKRRLFKVSLFFSKNLAYGETL